MPDISKVSKYMWITGKEDELEVKDELKNILGVVIEEYATIESANQEI